MTAQLDLALPARTSVRRRAPDGAALRDRGMDRALASAERAVDAWGLAALERLRALPAGEYMVEDMRAAAYAAGLPQPPSERAWGSVIVAARRLGVVRFLRYGIVANPRAHRTPAAVWQKH